MLVLSRKLNESICVGDNIVIKVVKIRGSVVGLGIVAPDNVKIMRNELIERDRQSGLKEFADCRPTKVPKSLTSANATKSTGQIAQTPVASGKIDTLRSSCKGITTAVLPIASLDVGDLVVKHCVESVTVAS